MATLLSLYQSILVAILSEWITDEDLCYLDCSVTQYKLRQHFLSILSKCSRVHKSWKLDSQDKYEWIQLRGIKLKSVYLSPEVNIDTKLLRQLLKKDELILLIEIECGVQLSEIVYGLELNVDHLIFKDTAGPIILDVLQKLAHVNHLDISECSVVWNTFDEHFYSLFPHAISISHCCIGGVPLMNRIASGLSGVPWTIGHLFVDNEMSVEHCESMLPYAKQMSSLSLYNKNNISKHIALHFINLIEFEADNIGLYDIDFINIFKACKHLRKIDVSLKNEWDFDVFVAIADYCRCLEEFRIRGAMSNAYGLQRIFDCCPLTCLNYTTWWNFPGLLIHAIKGAKSVKIRDHQVTFTEKDVTVKRNFDRGMKCVEYTTNFGIVDPDLMQVFKLVPDVRRMELGGLKLTDRHLVILTTQCPLLTSVSLLCCGFDYSLKSFYACSNLTALSLEDVSNITDDIVKGLVVDKPNFAKLALINCRGFTGEILATLSTYCVRMKYLVLTNNSTVYDEDVIKLLEVCKLLYHLDLSGCSGITNSIPPHLERRKRSYLYER